jgi:hypothetical protein
MEREQFDKKRAAWRKGVVSNKELAADIAMATGTRFADHGDTSYIQDFYSDLRDAGKNYVRSSAYLAWLVAHFPVKLVEKKFVKDHELAAKMNWADDTARTALVAKAAEKSFYDFAPEPEVQNFKADTIIESFEKAIKRFENSKHFAPENAEATAMLARAKDLVKGLKVAPANTNSQPELSSAAA